MCKNFLEYNGDYYEPIDHAYYLGKEYQLFENTRMGDEAGYLVYNATTDTIVGYTGESLIQALNDMYKEEN